MQRRKRSGVMDTATIALLLGVINLFLLFFGAAVVSENTAAQNMRSFNEVRAMQAQTAATNRVADQMEIMNGTNHPNKKQAE